MTHVNFSLKNLGTTFKLQNGILKNEVNHDEVYADTWRTKKNNGWIFLKRMFFVYFSSARLSKYMQKITRFGMKFVYLFLD